MSGKKRIQCTLGLLFICAASLFIFPNTLAAKDSVILQTGEIFVGQVLRVSDREVSIQLETGAVLSFHVQRVQKVRRTLPGKEVPEVTEFGHSVDIPGAGKRPEPKSPTPRAPTKAPVQKNAPPDTSPAPMLVGSPLLPVESNVHAKEVPANETRHWNIQVPPGFETLPPENGTEVVGTWIDPISQSVITLGVYPQAATGKEYRRLTLNSMQRELKPRIFRDQPVWDKNDKQKTQGWILDAEQTIAGNTMRQLHLFTNRNGRTYILRCSSPAKSFRNHSKEFDQCLRSLEIQDVSFEATRTTDNE